MMIFYVSLRSNTALTAYIALKWSTLVILHGYNKELDTSQILLRLIEAQANLSAAALAATDKKLSEKVYTLLAHEWTAINDIEVIYVDNLTKLELGNGVIILASLLSKYLVVTKRNDLVEQLKVSMKIILIEINLSRIVYRYMYHHINCRQTR